MKKINLVLSLVILSLTSACMEASFRAANLPSVFKTTKVSKDIDFGSEYGSKLDIYQPSEVKESYPVIVFYYGGKWTTGDKNNYRFVAEKFVSKGYIVVIPDYVKYPGKKFPAWEEDAAKSFAWVHNNIGKYKGDKWNVFALGHSAGAQIGALMATDGKYLFEEKGSPQWIKAFAGLAGPYSFTPEEADLKDMFGPPENYKYMQATTYVNANQPPMLLLWGKEDKDVADYNHKKMVLDSHDAGAKIEFKEYDGVDHVGIISNMAGLSLLTTPVAEDVDNFFKKYMN